jgi:phosphoribosylaminoimidazolecarboxamide formyltransferase/IMP cyclohydrolase
MTENRKEPRILLPVRRALISVTDKTGLAQFAQALHLMKVEVVSTGGTAKAIREAGVPVVDVADFTGFPEMMGGRVKTLHPLIAGGILFRRDDPKHVREAEEHGIQPIDMVVVNLYAFGQTIAKPDVTADEAIENIDIGGPTLWRAAAKSLKDVAVVPHPDYYGYVADEMRSNGGVVSMRTRLTLFRRVFTITSEYETQIRDFSENHLDVNEFGEIVVV